MVAPWAARERMDSRSGTGVLPAARVMMTVWLTPAGVYSVFSALAAAQKELLAQGALFARMTGSGSVTYGVFESAAAADRAAEALKGKWPVVLRTETSYE